ncbi:transcription and mRNA export factor ENY2-like [Sitophilus oryzae]|uniref:Enhancer of yellow 2 transcription factor n=1 Tax=Sitophilus oryzae TaxID=7048 RepID=A0A6J2XJN7_SITOR|nr:transcription and mRNA export factor ENY2-like [Sitophilus oryzae]
MPQEYGDRVSLHLDVNNGLDSVTELVHTRLVESGWKDEVRLACRKAIVESGDRVPTVDELISTITPKARALIREKVKRELLYKIEHILMNLEKVGYKDLEDI